MNSKEAYVIYAADDRFAEILGVSLISLFENSADMYEITVYVMDAGIKKENKDKLKSIAEKYSRRIIWIPACNISNVLSMDVTVDRGSLSQYARLFVSTSLPDTIERVLYLDCDTLIIKSIEELWNLNLFGKTIGALNDAFSSYYRYNIDLEPQDIMFNSGVMLIDLQKWRYNHIEEKLLDFIRKKRGVIQQGDQGVLNSVLSKDTYCIEPRFNAVTIFFDFSYKELKKYRKPPKEYYEESTIIGAIEEPSIIHFTSSFLSRRPWIVGSQHKYKDLWLYYKGISPWRDSPLWNEKTITPKRVVVGALQKMPRSIMISIAGIAQGYLRPFKQRIVQRSIIHGR